MTVKKKPVRKSRFDWERIELDYRTGRYSNRELTRLHGPSEAAIRKRAKDHGWQRDLSEQIRKRVIEKTTAAVAREVSRAETDQQYVEEAAEAGANIIRGHQRLLIQAKNIAETLMERLTEQLKSKTMKVEVRGEVMEVDVNLDYAGKSLGHATQALERVVKMERQSYGLDADDKETVGKTLDQLLAEVAPDGDE